MEHLRGVAEGHVDRLQLGRRSRPPVRSRSVGACTKKSSSAGSSPPPATSMYPPAPSPVSSGSATNDVSIAPTAASTALPPSRSTLAPASRGQRVPGRDNPLLTLRSWQSDSTGAARATRRRWRASTASEVRDELGYFQLVDRQAAAALAVSAVAAAALARRLAGP